jgi:hypothetical protein
MLTCCVLHSGSALWIYGDEVNDHGSFTVTINGSSPVTHSGSPNGCSGVGRCEKQNALKFFAGGLPAGNHDVTVLNVGTTFFGGLRRACLEIP